MKNKNKESLKEKINNIFNHSNNSFAVRGIEKLESPIENHDNICSYTIISQNSTLSKMADEERFGFSDFLLINPDFRNRIIKEFKQFIKELKQEIKVKDKEELRLEDGFIYRSDVIDIINKLSGFREENG